MNNLDLKYCLYARKSMEAEERQALSIDSQINELNDIALKNNLNIVCIKHESHSAKESGTREVFKEVLQDLKSGEYNAILTWNIDRLSRNAGDLGQIVDLIDNNKLLEVRTFTQIFQNTPNDKFLMMILGSQAKLENDNKSENVKRGMRARVESGLYPGVAPIGYLSSDIKGRECIKDVDPILGPVVKEMFEKVAYDNYTNLQLYFWLRDNNIKTFRGNTFNMGTIHAILKRPFYYGYFEFPKKSGHLQKGKHTPLITKRLYDRTQEVLLSHSIHRSCKRTGREPFTFSRFMRCGRCGSGIVADEQFKRLKNGKTIRYLYYYCNNSRTRECKIEYVQEKEIIKQFIDLFGSIDLNLINNKNEMDRILERYYKYIKFTKNIDSTNKSPEEIESDLRQVIQILFEEGDKQDKLGIIKLLKYKILLKDRKIYLDPSYITES